MMLKKFNKKHILSAVAVASIFVVANANAAVAGPYVGGQLGYGNVHQSGFSNSSVQGAIDGPITSSSNTNTNGGIAGRVFGGYQINKNFAAEMGYSKFSNATAKATANSAGDSIVAKSTIKTYAVDLVGKAILPLANCFNIYGKAGLAYLNANNKVTATVNDDVLGTMSASDKSSAGHIYPTFGAGVGYDLTQNVSTDLSWNRIQKTGSSDKLASTDLVALGLAYNFG